MGIPKTDKTKPATKPLDPVRQASEESFPASDPPSFNPGAAAPAPAPEPDEPRASKRKAGGRRRDRSAPSLWPRPHEDYPGTR